MILECPECGTRYLIPDSALGIDGRTVRCANCRHSWYQDAPDLAPGPGEEQEVPSEAPAAAETVATPPPPAPAPRRPARNVNRYRTIAALAAGALMLAMIGVILWTTAPGLAQRIGLPLGAAEPVLRIVDNSIERRRMSNGSELFAVSGRVTNPTAASQRVPDLRADLRDERGKIVFSWTISPQQRTLRPRAAVEFNSAQVDVPAASKQLDLSFVGETG